MFIRTTPRFLSAVLMVRVSRTCWSLVRDVCCEGVRLDGSCLYIRGRLSASSCLVCSIQWNLRITNKLVHRLMSAIRRLSFIGGFLPKILYFTFLSATHLLFYIFMTY